MATTVYDTLEIELSDGSNVTLRPLPIKQLKKFMVIIDEMKDPANEEKTEAEAMDVFIRAAIVCLEGMKSPLAENRDQFEEIIDTPTMMKILEVCGGLSLNDPNLLGASLVGMN